MPLHKSSDGFSVVGILIAVLIVGLVGAAGWYVYDKNRSKDPPANSETSEQDTTVQSDTQPANTYTPPEGWAKYEDTHLVFYFPPAWSKDDFEVSRVPINEYILAPLGGGGGGLRFKLAASDKKWEVYEPAADGGYTLSTLTGLATSDKSISGHPVGYGKIVEGGNATHYVLFTDGEYSYQLRLPLVSDPDGQSQASFEAKTSEQSASLEEIINSLVLK